ncbi:MAG: CIA30 family protein [Planctomycetota bacterium]
MKPTPRNLVVLLTGSLLATFSSLAQSDHRVHAEQPADWSVVVDGVMGGLSTGGVTSTASGTLQFEGILSLENNGGFSQIRREVRLNQYLIDDGIRIRVLGDGRKYIFDVRTKDTRGSATSYQREFRTLDGVWMTISLPFDSFVLKSYGRTLRNAPPISRPLIHSVGITLADKNPGSFSIEVASVLGYTNTNRPSPESTGSNLTPSDSAASQSMMLSHEAIKAGVRLFNSGDHRACALVYQTTLKAILAYEEGTLPGDLAAQIRLSMREAARAHSWTQKAWIYRACLDSILGKAMSPNA